MSFSASQVDVDSTGILLGAVLQSQFLADLLNAGLDFLDVASRVVSLAYDDVQVVLAMLLRVPDALLEDVLGLFDKLSVKINGVPIYAIRRIVLAEDVLRGLLVVLSHLCAMALAGLGQFVSGLAVAGLVGFVRLVEAVLPLGMFLTRQIAETVVFGLDFVGALMTVVGECWEVLLAAGTGVVRVMAGSN